MQELLVDFEVEHFICKEVVIDELDRENWKIVAHGWVPGLIHLVMIGIMLTVCRYHGNQCLYQACSTHTKHSRGFTLIG
jgi:hypothetical protein